MTEENLTYSRKALLGFAVMLLCIGIFSPFVAAFPEEISASRRVGMFRVLGPDILRLVGIFGTVVFLPMSVGAFRRLLGGAKAASIRPQGIEVNGPVMSHFITWQALEAVTVTARMVNGSVIGLIKARTNEFDDSGLMRKFLLGQSKGISTRLLVEDINQAARWAEKANLAKQAWTQGGRAPSVNGDIPSSIVKFGRRKEHP